MKPDSIAREKEVGIIILHCYRQLPEVADSVVLFHYLAAPNSTMVIPVVVEAAAAGHVDLR